MVRLGAGTEHITYSCGDDLVVRVPRDEPGEDAEQFQRERRLLAHLAPLLSVATSEIVAYDLATRTVVMSRIAGAPLLDVPVDGEDLVTDMAELLIALHVATPDVVDLGLAEPDHYPLQSYLDEAAASLRQLLGVLPRSQAQRVSLLVAQPPPPEPSLAVLCHNDLGAEHIFVDPRSKRLTGVIDWADAAIADPAHDLGRLYRDLGPDVTRDIISRLPYSRDDNLWSRVRLHAICSLLEDLVFGIEHDERYARAALANLERTLDPAAGPSPGPPPE